MLYPIKDTQDNQIYNNGYKDFYLENPHINYGDKNHKV